MGSVMRFVSVTMLLVSFVFGCQTMTGKTAGENIDDASITAAVKAKLAEDRPGTLTRIDVDTNQGTVYLNGVVENETRRQRAVELASQVSGVRRVVNNLTVQAPG
jgi:hyperosmotically inducible protein